jgi:hypothetical protein
MGRCFYLKPAENFRPAGPFGITLRAGCVMDGALGAIPHCYWLS